MLRVPCFLPQFPHPRFSLHAKSVIVFCLSLFRISVRILPPNCLDNQLWSHSLGAKEHFSMRSSSALSSSAVSYITVAHFWMLVWMETNGVSGHETKGCWRQSPSCWLHPALKPPFLPVPLKEITIQRSHSKHTPAGLPEAYLWMKSALCSFHLFPGAVWDPYFTGDLKFPSVLQPEVQGRSCVWASLFTCPGDLPGALLHTHMQFGTKSGLHIAIPMVQGPCHSGILFPIQTSARSGPFKCHGD